MIQKQRNNSSEYISCIRINGIPILPPLITPNKKKKLLEYKKQALDVEAKIRDRLNQRTFETQRAASPENKPEIVLENVPCRSADCLNLTCDLVEASEYSSSGIRLFNDQTIISESNNDDLHDESKNFCSPCVGDDLELRATPLIRSNSYTLESPSPLLLAHLKSMGLESSFGDEHTFQTLTSPDSAKSNFETEDKPEEKGALTVENEGENEAKTAEEEQLNWSDSVEIPNHEVSTGNLNEVQLYSPKDSSNLEDKTDLVATELDLELLKALNKLKLNEKEQILLLLKTHDQEQQQIPVNSELTALTPNSPLNCENNNISICSDISIDFPCVLTRTSKFSETKIDFFDESERFLTEKTVSNTVVRNILNCSEELLDDRVWLQKKSREQWAASVIVAHAKGYLTRRLMATERVCSLIETIKDALICAMELHNETTDSINESDVELHRRLVQQISAACYAFYDIFFTLSTAEKMAIIAHDRRRSKEKALKNLSLS